MSTVRWVKLKASHRLWDKKVVLLKERHQTRNYYRELYYWLVAFPWLYCFCVKRCNCVNLSNKLFVWMGITHNWGALCLMDSMFQSSFGNAPWDYIWCELILSLERRNEARRTSWVCFVGFPSFNVFIAQSQVKSLSIYKVCFSCRKISCFFFFFGLVCFLLKHVMRQNY